GDPNFFAFGEYFDGSTPPFASFQILLQLDNENLKPFTKDALEFLKNDKSAIELNWGFRAYSQFQDLLGLTMSNDSPVWNRHYCYYESLVYLRESITAWLDQNVLAAMALIRPFLELSIFHLYWYLRCEHNEYTDFYLWLEGKKNKPPFKNQLDYVFENLPTKDFVSSKQLEKVKEVLNNSYKSASTYNHTPKIDESIVSLGDGSGKTSFYLFFFYIASLNLVVRQLTYLYILAYPMSLFPVDRHKKWGYGGPVGLFFDFSNFAIIKEYVGMDNIQKMKADFPKLQEVKDLSSWYEGQPDLSESEIENTWQEFISDKPNSDINIKEHRMAFFRAHFRGLGWFVNYFHEPPKGDDEISDEMLEKVMRRINNW
ncbi:MAG TPA: hypothetical protein PLT08_17970, partial [Anaerolineales bacterium]|nr:hypothetical protein [Anaerolineales bacterium]